MSTTSNPHLIKARESLEKELAAAKAAVTKGKASLEDSESRVASIESALEEMPVAVAGKQPVAAAGSNQKSKDSGSAVKK